MSIVLVYRYTCDAPRCTSRHEDTALAISASSWVAPLPTPPPGWEHIRGGDFCDLHHISVRLDDTARVTHAGVRALDPESA